MADLGGAQPARAPPFEIFFYKCPPFLYMCPPFWNLKKKKKKKKKVSDSARLYPGCYLPPPPPDVDGAPEKKVWESPPLISFFGTCASFEAGGGPKKTSMLCPPFLKFLDPPLIHTMEQTVPTCISQQHWRMHYTWIIYGKTNFQNGNYLICIIKSIYI